MPTSPDTFTSPVVQAFYDAAPVMMGVVQLEGDDIRHLSDNKSATDHFGLTPGSAAGKLASELGVPKETLALWIKHYKKAQATGIPQTFSYTSEFAGRIQYFQVTVNLLKLNLDEYPSFCYVVNDVTELTEAHQKLRASQEREFSTTFEQAAIGLAHVALDGTFLRVNTAYAQIVGVSKGELLQKHFQDLAPHDESLQIWENIYELTRGKVASLSKEMRYFRKSGEVVWVSFNVSLLTDDNNVPQHFVVVMHDISDEVRSEQQLRELNESYRIERDKLEAIFRNASIGLGLADAQGNTVALNNEGLRIHDFSSDEEMFFQLARYAQEFELRFPNGSLMPFTEWPMTRALHGDYVRNYDLILTRPTKGTSKYVIYTAAPIFDNAGAIRNIVFSIADVTERMKADEARRKWEFRFQTMADNISQLAWMADEKGSFFWYNKRWFEYTGTTFEEAKDVGWLRVQHPDHADRVLKKLFDSFQKGDFWEDTFPLRGHNGLYRWFLSRAVPIHDSSGKVILWFGTNTDITELREAQERAVFFSNALENSSQPFASAYSDGTLKIFNKAFASLTGYTIDELKSVNWMNDLTPPEWRTIQKAALDKLVETGQPQVFEKEYLRKDQSRVAIEVKVQLVRDEHERPDYYFAFVTDITKRRQAEKEREELLNQAQEALALRDEFLSIASHELKTPLTALKLQQQLLIRTLKKTPDEQSMTRTQKLAGDMGRQLDRLERLIEDLLDVSRIQNGKLTFRFEPVNVAELVEDVVGQFVTQLSDAECSLNLELPEGLTAQWDRMRVEQIVWNFVSNAIKYAPHHPIDIRAYPTEGSVRIAVRDFGPGIPKEMQKIIFERFERGEARQGTAGLGLGLFIVKSIAEGHNGAAWVESEPGHGSIFFVELPLAPQLRSTPNATRRAP